MKKIISIAAAALAAVAAHAGGFVTLVDGPAQGTLIVGASGTNGPGAITNNAQNGCFLALSTNVFTLYAGVGYRVGTNLWPSAGFSTAGGTEANTGTGPSYGPWKTVGLYTFLPLTGTNAVAKTVVVRYAGSLDASHWVTNAFVQTFNPAADLAYCLPAMTNFDSGAYAYWALQAVESTLTNCAVTNALLQAGGKSGL